MFHNRTDHPVTLHDVSFVPDLGFYLFSFHVVQEKHDIILNKAGAHLLNGRLAFPRRRNGQFLRITRVLREDTRARVTHWNISRPPFPTFRRTPSPVQYSSETSPVAHEKPRMSSSRTTSNAGAEISGKNSSVAWGKGEVSESVLSGNDGTAAAVLSPGGILVIKNKKRVLDINHFHVSLAHAHSSVPKATAQQHGIQLVGELAQCSGC